MKGFAERSRRSLAQTVIRPEESPHRIPAARTLLRGTPGLELRRYGGLGAFSSASLRGSGGPELAIYLDGVLTESSSIGGDCSGWDAGYVLALGDEPTGGRPWLGIFDLVAIYDRALSAAEVRNNYRAGRP